MLKVELHFLYSYKTKSCRHYITKSFWVCVCYPKPGSGQMECPHSPFLRTPNPFPHPTLTCCGHGCVNNNPRLHTHIRSWRIAHAYNSPVRTHRWLSNLAKKKKIQLVSSSSEWSPLPAIFSSVFINFQGVYLICTSVLSIRFSLPRHWVIFCGMGL